MTQNRMACGSGEDSVQSEFLHRLIRVFAVGRKKPWSLSYLWVQAFFHFITSTPWHVFSRPVIRGFDQLRLKQPAQMQRLSWTLNFVFSNFWKVLIRRQIHRLQMHRLHWSALFPASTMPGRHWPPSEMPSNGILLADQWWPAFDVYWVVGLHLSQPAHSAGPPLAHQQNAIGWHFAVNQWWPAGTTKSDFHQTRRIW